MEIIVFYAVVIDSGMLIGFVDRGALKYMYCPF